MKQFVAIVMMTMALSLYAQEFEYKYGKVSNEEVTMTQYTKDPDADAVILKEKVQVYYDMGVNGIKLITEISRRIKILKDAGKEWGDVEFTFYDTPQNKEYISGLEGASYNMVNGKVVKTSLEKKYITTEKISDARYRRKFTLPEVKVGSVLEYKYKITSDYFYDIPSVYFQHGIPTQSAYVEVSIPEYFRFDTNMRGHRQVQVVRGTESSALSGVNPRVSFYCSLMKFFINDMPALKKEPYVWCINEFRAGVDYEINALDMLTHHKSFSISWADVHAALNRSNFGSQFKTKNPYKAEVEEIVAETEGNHQERITRILRLVQDKITWNGKRDLISESVSKAVKEGVGGSADKNFVLAGALRDAGYNVSAVLLSPREYGRLPLTHPTQEKIRSFILRVQIDDNTAVYLDAASKYSGINILPTNLLVDRARLFDPIGDGVWLDLSRPERSIRTCYAKTSITEDGEMKGTVTLAHANQFAYEFGMNYDKYKDNNEYRESLEKKYDITIDNVNVGNVRTARCNESFSFTKPVTTTDSMIYVNAFALPFLSDNPFKDLNRTLPVEFSFPSQYKYITEIDIPEGYAVSDLPESTKVTTCNGALTLSLLAQDNGFGKVNLILELRENEPILPAEDISKISGFYAIVAELSNSQIVFKKL